MVGRKTMITFFVDLPRFDQARCAEVEDKDFFFPDGRKLEAERLHQLKAICHSCIHEKECLAYALKKQIDYGIWGGKTPDERYKELQKTEVHTFTGISLVITQLHAKGLSAHEIAAQLYTSKSYVVRILKKLAATEQGANQLHQQKKNSSKGLG
jgi:WhiB family redox-sensing transcriptional regulator